MRVLLTLLMWMVAVPAVAQTLTTDLPASTKAIDIFVKIAAPILSALSPFLTKYVTMGMLKVVSAVPASLQTALSSVFSAVILGLAGAFTDFPLSTESAATVGLGIGAASQSMASAKPETVNAQPNVGGMPGTAPGGK